MCLQMAQKVDKKKPFRRLSAAMRTNSSVNEALAYRLPSVHVVVNPLVILKIVTNF
jgi:hypothetical protein